MSAPSARPTPRNIAGSYQKLREIWPTQKGSTSSQSRLSSARMDCFSTNSFSAQETKGPSQISWLNSQRWWIGVSPTGVQDTSSCATMPALMQLGYHKQSWPKLVTCPWFTQLQVATCAHLLRECLAFSNKQTWARSSTSPYKKNWSSKAPWHRRAWENAFRTIGGEAGVGRRAVDSGHLWRMLPAAR